MDIPDETLHQEANLFYDNVRALVIVFLTVSVLLPLSYLIVASKRLCKEPCLSQDDLSIHRFIMGVCAFTMTISATMVFMLPLSTLANEVLILFPDCYYVQWINTGLLHSFFVFVQISFKATCVLIPFSFFFLSSHSVYKGSKAVSSRFFYSLLYLAVTYLALFGIFTTLASTFMLTFNFRNTTDIYNSITRILPHACFNSTIFYYSWPLQVLGDFICSVDSALIFMEQSISYIGLGLLLFSIPSGIRCLIIQILKASTTQSLRSAPNDVYDHQAADMKYHLQFERCLRYIEGLNEPLRRSLKLQVVNSHYQLRPYTLSEIPAHIYCWESKKSINSDTLCCELKQSSPRTSRSLLSSLAFLVLLTVLLVAALYASMNVIVLLYHLLLSRTHFHAGHSSRSTILLGYESVSKFGFVGASLQALMVVFVICTGLIGFYSIPSVHKHIYPRAKGANMALLLLNVTCILSMSSAVPLHASLLGLATPSFPPFYYSSLNEGFCRASNDPCLQPIAEYPLFPGSGHQTDEFPLKQSLQGQTLRLDRRDSSPSSRNPTHRKTQHHGMPLLPSSPTRGIAIVLLYNLGFISVCWWLFRLHARDLVKVKEQLASVWVVLVKWWLGSPPSTTTSR